MAPILKFTVLRVCNFCSACTLNAKWSQKNFEDRKNFEGASTTSLRMQTLLSY